MGQGLWPSRCFGGGPMLAGGELGDQLRRIFTTFLRSGRFPNIWKTARVILIPKQGKSPGTPSAYRSICLLDEAGNLFERILVRRLVQHLTGDGPDLSEGQNGFLPEKSTVDVIVWIRSLVEPVKRDGGVVLAESLAIANAFNSLPWKIIRKALDFHRVPQYLKIVLKDYFRSKNMVYRDQNTVNREKRASRRIPQESTLGLYLWNLAFDKTLRTALPLGTSVICCADDTLILSGGVNWEQADLASEMTMEWVVHTIHFLGLRMPSQKTEAVFFHDGSYGRSPGTHIKVDGARVLVGVHINYLGLHIDET